MKMNRQRVLVIDDQEGLGSILQILFDVDQIDLVQETSGTTGLERLRQEPFSGVILDLGLPDTHGAEVLEAIRREPSWANLPVVILTGSDSMEERVKLFQLGASDYVTKPYHPSELRMRITRLLRMVAAEMEARNRAGFIAQMSHEIRNPMNGIIATSEMLLDSGLSEAQRQMVQTICLSGKSCLGLVNDILDFSKLESNKMEFEAEPFSLRHCVESVFDLVTVKAAEKNLDLVVLLGSGMSEWVMGDRKRVQQVLLNLVGNAVKFTDRGEVVVELCRLESWDSVPEQFQPAVSSSTGTLAPAGDFLLAKVRDTGSGISENVLPNLFQAYTQASSRVQHTHGGTGLGLAISKRIVQALGGSIWAESVVGQGSTFSFCLPAQETAEPNTEANAENTAFLVQPRSEAGLRENILIIEDGASSRAFLQAEVQRLQFEPVACANPQEALAWLANHRARAVIVDDRVKNPADLAMQMRKLNGNMPLPLLLLASITSKQRELAEVPQPFRRVYKPLKLEAIRQGLNQLVQENEPSVIAPGAPTAPAAQSAKPKVGELYPVSILLADDNQINQQVGMHLLRRIGCTADMASDGAEVLAMLAKKHYDVLLLDIQMPVMDGFAVAKAIRQQEREAAGQGRKLPMVIVAVTANAMRGDREQMMEAGMNDYLSKPVDPATFEATLGRWARYVHGVRNGVKPEAAEASQAAAVPSAPEVAPVRPANGNRPKPVDLRRFREIAGPSDEDAVHLRQLFLDRTTDLVRNLQQALMAGDRASAAKLAHKGAGSSGTCGMMGLAERLREVERFCESGGTGAPQPMLAAVKQEFDEVRDFMAKEM